MPGVLHRARNTFRVRHHTKYIPALIAYTGYIAGSAVRVCADMYFALLIASLPFTVVEAAFRAGSTIMLEARVRP